MGHATCHHLKLLRQPNARTGRMERDKSLGLLPLASQHLTHTYARSSPKSYFIPIQRPSLLRRPDLVSGMPVAREILRLAFVTPNARFHEKVSPGPSFMTSTYTRCVARCTNPESISTSEA